MNRLLSKVLIPLFALSIISSTQVVSAASIFLTGHDPDFHASNAAGTAVDSQGAVNINKVAIEFILDPAFNLIANGGVSKFFPTLVLTGSLNQKTNCFVLANLSR